MGAIYGVYDCGGTAFDPEGVEALGVAMAHRGSDVVGGWRGKGVVLGVRLLHTTPESLQERPPGEHGEGRLVIAGDCRIDNRDEVRARLSDPPPQGSADSQLVLAAYVQWGTDCLQHLIGDFAFAIYDPDQDTLFCARDHFGVKPFCYSLEHGRFAFASEVKALVVSGLASDEVDEERIADFLLMRFEDKAITFYRHVRRLPPAHAMLVQRKGFKTWRYWQPVATDANYGLDDEAAAAQFRQLFEQAVECRLRSVCPVGSYLSGGLDSSAVTVVANRLLADSALPLQTFSTVFPSVPKSDESRWMALVELQAEEEGRPLRRHFFRGDSTGPLEVIDEITDCLGAPCSAANMYQSWHMLRMAHDAGVRVMLTGHDGDTVVSHGLAVITESAISGRWDEAARYLEEIAAVLENYGDMRKSLARTYLATVPAHLWRAGRRVRALYAIGQLFRRYGGSRKAMLREMLGRAATGANPGLASPSFAASSAFLARQALPGMQMAASAAQDHVRGIDSGLMACAFEDIECISSAFGIESRHPFFDQRLVEFCLSLPVRHKIRDGWTRVLQRKAMRGVLPEVLRLRPDKSNLGHNFTVSLKHGGGLLQALAGLAGAKGGFGAYIDSGLLEQIRDRYEQEPTERDALLLYLAAGLASWMR